MPYLGIRSSILPAGRVSLLLLIGSRRTATDARDQDHETWHAERVLRELEGYPYVRPVPYARIAQLNADADTVIVY